MLNGVSRHRPRQKWKITHFHSDFQPNSATNSFVLLPIQQEHTPLPATLNEIEIVIRELNQKNSAQQLYKKLSPLAAWSTIYH